ncbi:MAG TPA: DUF2786 domain-containing protein [Mycobacteriales bacterium]|nr:DUF2786 domain-containing protein [Mycobacteriales bacterium]
MGKRGRRRAREQQGRPGAGRPDPQPHRVERLVAQAATAFRHRDEAAYTRWVDALLACWPAGAGAADPVPGILLARLRGAVAAAWPRGWQPVDLHGAVRRELGPQHAGLAAAVITSEACGYRGHPYADQRWLVQLDALPVTGRDRDGDLRLETWVRAAGLDRAAALRCALEALSFLWHVPTLPRLCAPPGEWSRPGRPGGASPARDTGEARVLDRIRALLSKAESTAFPAEAEAFTAKAQEMMSRHAIDHALLAADAAIEEPEGRRIPIDDPYAMAKAALLAVVAGASRCRTVWSGGLGFCTVFGFRTDLDGVEMLYTSLLVQGTSMLLAAGRAGPRQRSRSYRQSFLSGFATRIGQRLEQAAESAIGEAAAEHGDRLLPVLAGRTRAVDDACERAFAEVQRRPLSIGNGAGWVAGTVAADLATLGGGRPVEAASSA